jgi:hypothetical protein
MGHIENIAEILLNEGHVPLANEILCGAKNDELCESLINAFENFKNPENKNLLIVQIGYSKDIRFFDFLEYCVFNAADNIRHGTLKYIAYFKHEKNLIPIFEKIERMGLKQSYEPYFSISAGMIGGECKSIFDNS